jgi:N6-L-threonylcarbamoyladenine synthase
MNVLGIETSCDETAVAVVSRNGKIISNIVLSQLEEHRAYGGVVPEIAARSHLDHLDHIINAAMLETKLSFAELHGVAATCGPGLIGGVMVGMMAGKSIAAACDLPFVAVNHLEAHALTPRLTEELNFPYLLLLVSGGHTQLLIAEEVGNYRLLGTTLDDAAGECFDKSAKIMGLPYPGGPNIEKAAKLCKKPQQALETYELPRPMTGRTGCDFSFSGLKTAVRTHADTLYQQEEPDIQEIAMLASALQDTIAAVISDRCENAIKIFKEQFKGGALVVSGGVAANSSIRSALKLLTARHDMYFIAPPTELCSDNAAMVAWAGVERLRRGFTDSLDFAAKPRWPLASQA